MQISIDDLKAGINKISSVVCAYYAESASVCLKRMNHQPQMTQLLIKKGQTQEHVNLLWSEVERDEGYLDMVNTVENGAYGVSFLVVLHSTQYTIAQQAFRGKGFDFWLSQKEESDGYDPYNFLNAKLEVSGILDGGESQIAERKRQKEEQIKKGADLEFPCIVSIVEFGTPECNLTFHD